MSDEMEQLERHGTRACDEINARAKPALAQLECQTNSLAMSKGPRWVKYRRLQEIADEAAALVAPNTPCRKGCSDCCYQAVPIGIYEADRLSNASGRPINRDAGRAISVSTIARLRDNTERLLQNPTPCPFLFDGACSVYADRPISCRTHHVLHPDASRCNLFAARDSGKPMPQVKYDLRWIEEASADLMLAHDDPVADIREFFGPAETLQSALARGFR